jgi:hypothetical protein
VTNRGDFFGDLARGKMPPCPALRLCDNFSSISLICGSLGLVGEAHGIEIAELVAAPKVTGADLPTDVAAAFQVMGREPPSPVL